MSDDVICARVKINMSGSKSPMALTTQLALIHVSVSLKASGHLDLFWALRLMTGEGLCPTESPFLSKLKVRLGPNLFTSKTFTKVL